jgi:multiple sugar transport system permease protein
MEQDYFAQPPVMFPHPGTLKNFVDIFQKYQLVRGFRNSFLIAGLTTVCTVFFGSLASYSLINGFLPRKIKGFLSSWFLIQDVSCVSSLYCFLCHIEAQADG